MMDLITRINLVKDIAKYTPEIIKSYSLERHIELTEKETNIDYLKQIVPLAVERFNEEYNHSVFEGYGHERQTVMFDNLVTLTEMNGPLSVRVLTLDYIRKIITLLLLSD